MSDMDDPRYKDWVRSAFSLNYLKDGVCDFVDRFTKQHHVNLKHSYIKCTGRPAVSCSECTSENLLPDHPRHHCIQKFRSKCFCNHSLGRRKCRNSFCSRFYDLIVMAHDEANPLWINTDPARWYTDHWEVAKCFLATTGYKDKKTASDTDAAGLLSIMVNNIEIRNHLDCIDNVIKVRDIRNEIMHSKSFRVDRSTLHRYIDQIILVLQDSKVLINDEAAQKAVAKLEKLKRDKIYISSEDVYELRRQSLVAIEERKDDVIHDIENKQKEIIDSLDSQHGNWLVEQKKRTEAIENAMKEKIQSSEKQAKENIDTYFDSRSQKYESRLEKEPKENTDILVDSLAKDEEELQRYLLDFYKHYICIPISPLSSWKTNVEELYVPLEATIICNDRNDNVTKLKDLFQIRNICLHTIYLTGDAGLGKSTFCKKLISLWCALKSGKTPNDYNPVFDFETKTSTEEETNQYVDTFNDDYDFYLINSSSEEDEISDQDDSDSSGQFNKDTTKYTEQGYLCDSDIYLGNSSSNKDKEDEISDQSDSDSDDQNKITDDQRFQNDHFERDKFAIAHFEFLFFVSLSDANQEVTVEDMIIQQLRFRNNTKLVECFKQTINRIPERCLIILDGLDEWTPPLHPIVKNGLPVDSLPQECVKLITSRKWKYEALNPRNKEDESEVRLTGVGENASMKLIENVFKASGKINARDLVMEFKKEVNRSYANDLVSVPLLLKLLICLWQEYSRLESSKTKLYSSIIDLMLCLAIKKDVSISPSDSSTLKLPESFEGYDCIKNSMNIIGALSKFAFNLLYKQPDGLVLVPDLNIVSGGLNQEQREKCLQIGFLTQRSVSNFVPKISLSFIHKSFQEYFAALYISICDRDEVRNFFSHQCDENRSIQEMANVLYFLAGLNEDLFLEILEQLASDYRMETKITFHDRNLTLSLKDEVDLTCIFLMGNPKSVVIDSTHYGLYGFRFTEHNHQLQSLELKSVSMTHRAFKTMLESVPVSKNGVTITLECIAWVNEHLEVQNLTFLVEIQNTKKLKIKFTNLTRLEFKLPKNIQSVELSEVTMTDISLSKMLNSVSETVVVFELTMDYVDILIRSTVQCLTICHLLTMAISPEMNKRVQIGSLSISTKNTYHRATGNSSQSYQLCELRISDTDLMIICSISKNVDVICLENGRFTTDSLKTLFGDTFYDNIQIFEEHKNQTLYTNVKNVGHIRPRLYSEHKKYGHFYYTLTNTDSCFHYFLSSGSRQNNRVVITCLKCTRGQECTHYINYEDTEYLRSLFSEVSVIFENKRSEVTGLTGVFDNLKHIGCLTITCDAMTTMNEEVVFDRIKSLSTYDQKVIYYDNSHVHIQIEQKLGYLYRSPIRDIAPLIESLTGLNINMDFFSVLQKKSGDLIIKSPIFVTEIKMYCNFGSNRINMITEPFNSEAEEQFNKLKQFVKRLSAHRFF